MNCQRVVQKILFHTEKEEKESVIYFHIIIMILRESTLKKDNVDYKKYKHIIE